MAVGMPVGARAVRLEAGDDPDREVTLARQRADRGRDGAGRDPGDLAEQESTIQTIRAEPLGMVRTTCRCGTGARSVASSHCVQSARRFAWQLGQKYRHLQENANRYSRAQSSRANAREPVLEDAAGQELVRGIGNSIGDVKVCGEVPRRATTGGAGGWVGGGGRRFADRPRES